VAAHQAASVLRWVRSGVRPTTVRRQHGGRSPFLRPTASGRRLAALSPSRGGGAGVVAADDGDAVIGIGPVPIGG
jgi:hypothetical protein